MTVMTVNVHEAKTQLYDILVQKLAEHFGERLKMLVLFGSQSRGEERRDSDHDIFMVVEDLSHDPLVRQREIMTPLLPVLIHLPERLSVIAKTPHELLGNLSPLVMDVCMDGIGLYGQTSVSYTHLRAHETVLDLVCRLLLEQKKKNKTK